MDRVNHIGPFMQDVLWTVELVAPPTPPPAPLTGPIVEKACTPKRASYVADLRDDALNNTGFNPANVHAYGVGYAGLSLPDSPKPADAYYYGAPRRGRAARVIQAAPDRSSLLHARRVPRMRVGA